MNQGDNEQRRRRIRSRRTRVQPSQGAGSMDVELATLIEEHLLLVKHVALQVAVQLPRHFDRDELARAGALGLVDAARRYNEARGVPFERFAAQRIRGGILDAVRAADWAPRSVRSLASQLKQAEQHLAAELGRMPDNNEVAEALDMSGDELDQLQHRRFRSVVLNLEHAMSHEGEKDLTLVDLVAA